jgi:cobalt-zinc-cadmium efflux system membrane fusion protein
MNTRITLSLLSALLTLEGCERHDHAAASAHDHEETPSADFERGRHGGRLLRDGDFTLEVTIFEAGVPPEFRLYAYQDGEPLPAADVGANIELTRLGGEVDSFDFTPEGQLLRGSGEVIEPHSFDVRVTASHAGESHEWRYASYEGRTTIAPDIARTSGIEVETAGPAVIRDQIQVLGNVVINEERHAALKARFEGTVREVHVRQGDAVKSGQALLTIEANESMRNYTVEAPFAGIVLARSTNVGNVTNGNTLLEIADLSQVWLELHALGEPASRIAVGQRVRVKAAIGDLSGDARINAILPVATRGQSVIARAVLDNSSGQWRPGMTVSAEVTVGERQVPLAVRESALQRFRDFTVVFARIGDTYEVRMLDLGARDGEYAEVLGGLDPGTVYVTQQSFLIKADIEKSGASHDH